MAISLSDCLVRLQEARNQNELVDLLRRLQEGGDFATAGYVRLPPDDASPFFVSTHPPEWDRRYFQNRYYARDPFVRRARNRILPFHWVRGVAAGWRFNAQEKAFVEEAGEFGFDKALFCPVHSPDGAKGVLALSSAASHTGFEVQVKEHGAALQLFALHLHAHVSGILAEGEERPPSELTERETAVIGHYAAGLAAPVIAEKLGISPRTVSYHAENAKRKLQAKTMTQCVAHAIRRGLMPN